MQLLVHSLGGDVAGSGQREYGLAEVRVPNETALLPEGTHPVWMSHGDHVRTLPEGFTAEANSENGIIAAISDHKQKIFGLQFHPEVNHTQNGPEMLAPIRDGSVRGQS